MTTPTTVRRRINADVFRRARREGATLDLAAYVARPPVLDLTWEQGDAPDYADRADFTLDGRHFRAYVEAPEGGCESCAELVAAWRDRDENIAWMTEEEYDQTEHRILKVVEIDADGDEISDSYLGGTCGRTSTYVDRLADERYLAESVADVASWAADMTDRADAARAERIAARQAEREARIDHMMPPAIAATVSTDAARVLATVWADETAPRESQVAATYFALLGRDRVTLDDLTAERHAELMDQAERVTPTL